MVLAAGTALRVGSASASSAVALAQQTAARLDRVEAYLNTATYAVSGSVTTAPNPAPFSGAVAVLPRSVASVVATPVAATTEAAVASSRLYTDD